MVQGLAFLSKKGFNPQNQDNRKRVWEAQQASKQEKERLQKRQEQLKREKEEEELERVTKGEIGSSQAQLRFMYDAPPGMNKEPKTSDVHEDRKPTTSTANGKQDLPTSLDQLKQANSGDDAAAAAFRRMLAASVQDTVINQVDNEQGSTYSEPAFKFAPVLQGTTVGAQEGDGSKGREGTYDGRSTLEKAVGRKDRSTQNLSYQQQIERFPQLKNAPMVHSMKKATGEGNEQKSEQPMLVNFKPLGAQILHVRCLACGVWGHQRGDRECAKSGWNPFALPSKSHTVAAAPTSATGASSIHIPKSDNHRHLGDSKRSAKSRRSRDRSDDGDSSYERRRHRRHRRRSRKRGTRKHDESSRNIEGESSDSDHSHVSVPPSGDSQNMTKNKVHYCSDVSEDEGTYRDGKRRPKSPKTKKRKRGHEDSSRRKKKKHKSPRRSDSD